MNKLKNEIKACVHCAGKLPLGPRPVVRISPASRILIIGQAPGTKVHASGIPWDDRSGVELRRWLGVNSEQFYDESMFGIVPMGFCYPGRGKGGDLPPRPECAPLWHSRILSQMPEVELTLLIGSYAQSYYLGKTKEKTLTKTVYNYQQYLPQYFPLVHPSPRNLIWQKRNPWFEQMVVPALQLKVSEVINK
jgi:uracil-DNA glycosylase